MKTSILLSVLSIDESGLTYFAAKRGRRVVDGTVRTGSAMGQIVLHIRNGGMVVRPSDSLSVSVREGSLTAAEFDAFAKAG